MQPDYQHEPCRKVPEHLRDWFEQAVERLETEAHFPIWRVILPAGSSVDDAISISRCLLVLFPERAKAERNEPVEVAFQL